MAADEAGFSDYAKYAEIYNKANATAEEVEEAAKALKQDIVNWKSSEATPDKPVEFTNAIANNSFADGNNGWNVVGSIGHQSGTSYETADNKYKMDHFSEKWVTSANNGNLSGNPMDISQYDRIVIMKCIIESLMIIPFMSFSRKFIGHKSILVKMRYQGVPDREYPIPGR